MAESQPPSPAPSEVRQPEQHGSADQRPNTSPTNAPAHQSPAVVHEPRAEPNQNAPDRQREKHDNEPPFNRWNTGLVTLFTAVLAIVGALQYCSMQQQARYMQKQADYMRDGLEITKQSNVVAARAAKAAEDSVALARQTSRLDQRAWVAVKHIEGTIKLGEPIKATVTISNSGKTFAKQVAINCLVQPFYMGANPAFESVLQEKEAKGGIPKSVVAPGAEMSFPFILQPVTEDLLNRLQGQTEIFAFGKITYEDVFQCAHWTTFAWKMRADGVFRVYDTYNDADDNECR